MTAVVCPYCVQWRCAACKVDDCDHVALGLGDAEPYWPDGSVAVLTTASPCEEHVTAGLGTTDHVITVPASG